MNKKSNRSLLILILAASFGYFVDAYDLIVASLVRTESIIALGLAQADDIAAIKSIGLSFETWLSWGLLLGGVTFGILGDRVGRMQVLYGSIALYSIATLLNGLLDPSYGIFEVGNKNIYSYYCLFRFLAGFGLAAEMGTAVTIVSEEMEIGKRGYGSMAIAAIGLLGAVLAAWMSEFTDIKWSTLFIIGGVLGIALLIFRFRSHESKIYERQGVGTVGRGAFFSLFTSADRFKKLLICIGIGLPSYLVIGLPLKFAPNFGKALNIDNVSLPLVIITFYVTMAFSDVICNFFSQKLRSRKIMFYIYNTLSLIAILLFTFISPKNAWEYQYIFTPILGFSVGYWALITTVAAESFGTNLRATVTTSVPNFLRASFIPIAALFALLESKIGTINAGGLIGVICSAIALVATYFLKDNFSESLDFEE